MIKISSFTFTAPLYELEWCYSEHVVADEANLAIQSCKLEPILRRYWGHSQQSYRE